MIIHTRKYKHFDQGHISTAKAGSKKIKESTQDRRRYLDQIRTKEVQNREQNLKRIPYNKLSDFFGVAGVYFLMQGGAVVYIGETSCIVSRLAQHRQDKEFDGFRLLRVDDAQERLRLEKAYIQKHSPRYNIIHNPSIGTAKPVLRLIEDLSQR